MKIDLRKSTLSAAIVLSLYAAYRVVTKCLSWAGIHLFAQHPVRGEYVGELIEAGMLFFVALFFFAVWTNRNKLPKLNNKWKSIRLLITLTIVYEFIMQLQMICTYPVSISHIFYNTVWLCPVIFAVVLWLYYVPVKALPAQSGYRVLRHYQSTLILCVVILLILSVIASIILYGIWYNIDAEWLYRWHWRIPLMIKAVGEILFILFLTIKNN